ncbi:MAG: hypothetical protein ACPGR2_17610 [Psychrobium sp.]
MKNLLLLMAVVGIGVYGYENFYKSPTSISNPIYLESRVNLVIPDISRNIEMVLLGEMASRDECAERKQLLLARLLKKCKECSFKTISKTFECKAELTHRNKLLFSDIPMDTTYLSLSSSNSHERNARLLLWGLSDEEAQFICKKLKGIVKHSFNGTAKCIS